jgi:hypothetical protein
VALRASFAPIRGIGAGFRPPKTARTEQLSTTAALQSSASAKPSSSSSNFQMAPHTPATCQSRNRRQQVMPLPQPISLGRYSQGEPDFKMKMIPVRHWRSGTRGRPPLGLGAGAGSRG